MGLLSPTWSVVLPSGLRGWSAFMLGAGWDSLSLKSFIVKCKVGNVRMQFPCPVVGISHPSPYIGSRGNEHFHLIVMQVNTWNRSWMMGSCGHICAVGEMSPTLHSACWGSTKRRQGCWFGLSLAVWSGKHVHLPLVKKLPLLWFLAGQEWRRGMSSRQQL